MTPRATNGNHVPPQASTVPSTPTTPAPSNSGAYPVFIYSSLHLSSYIENISYLSLMMLHNAKFICIKTEALKWFAGADSTSTLDKIESTSRTVKGAQAVGQDRGAIAHILHPFRNLHAKGTSAFARQGFLSAFVTIVNVCLEILFAECYAFFEFLD